jgi:hypothetical protein
VEVTRGISGVESMLGIARQATTWGADVESPYSCKVDEHGNEIEDPASGLSSIAEELDLLQSDFSKLDRRDTYAKVEMKVADDLSRRVGTLLQMSTAVAEGAPADKLMALRFISGRLMLGALLGLTLLLVSGLAGLLMLILTGRVTKSDPGV